MFDPSEVFNSGGGKFLNAKFLKTLPRMACKVCITGGGVEKVPTYEDKTKLKNEAFLTVTSTSFEGEKRMALNKTNYDILARGLGQQPDSWRGKEIGVFFDALVKVGDEVKGGLRVKVFEADPFAEAAPAKVAVPADSELAPF